MRARFIEDLVRQAEADERIWLLTGDLGFNVLEPFADRFPDRFVNVGVAEQNMTGLAAGLALNGKIPFTYSIANFSSLRCLEQIRNDIAYHKLPARIVSVGGGVAYGAAGYTHHALEDLAILRTLPELRVFAPADPDELTQIMAFLRDCPYPAYLRLGKGGEESFTTSTASAPFEPFKPRVICAGETVALLSTGVIGYEAFKAAQILAHSGVRPKVITLPQLDALDAQALSGVLENIETLFLIEEHVSASALHVIYEQAYEVLHAGNIQVQHISFDKDVRYEIGSRQYLLQRFRLDGEGIADRVRAQIQNSNS